MMRVSPAWWKVTAVSLLLGGAAALWTDRWEAAAVGDWRGAAYLATGCLAALVLIPWAVAAGRRRLDLFEPIIMLSGIWALGYLVPAILVLTGVDPTWLRWQTRVDGGVAGLVFRALMLALIGFVSLLIGYYAPVPAVRPGAPPAPVSGLSLNRWQWVAIAAIAASFMLFLSRVGGIEVVMANLNDRVRLFAGNNFLLLPLQALLGFAVLAHARRLLANRPMDGWLIAGTVIAFALNTFQASKTTLFGAAVALVVVWHYLRRPLRVLPAAALVVLAMVAAVTFDLFFREYLILREVVTVDLGGGVLRLASQGWAFLAQDAFLQLQTLMVMIDGMPERLGWQAGAPYLGSLLAAVPRGLYPGKPPVGTEIFSRAFFPDLLAGGTSIPTSLLGEFYMNFGPLGVIIGCLLAGVALRRLYIRMTRSSSTPLAWMTYACVCGTLFPWVRGDTFGPTVFFLSVVVPSWLLVHLSRQHASAVASDRGGR